MLKLKENSPRIHIFYSVPVKWYTENLYNNINNRYILDNNATLSTNNLQLKQLSLNTQFYPYLGPYNQTPNTLRKQFENLQTIGIGVLIVDVDTNKNLLENIFHLALKFNLSITFAINVDQNYTLFKIQEKLRTLQKYIVKKNFYKIFSISKKNYVPLIYVNNAFKMKYNNDEKSLCSKKSYTSNGDLDPILIGHIRLKEDAEKMRRLCFNGYYTKSPSNGAFFASTWKNWNYLNKFATLYNLIFIPTVGPGYKEKKKNLKNGNLHRDRSNGQYYGYAWRTAINNHIGFINIASYNNWQEGTQIEEAIPKVGYDNYEPGLPYKYLDLTANWINSFLTEKRRLLEKLNCYNFLNNTIC